jgi:2-polyprenyl-3-methyl-5-hydroxy-6-metoxy-1,4-benzoquinol methylase
MHTGYYDDYDDTTVFTRQDHLDAQTRMMKELLGKWDHLLRVARAAQEEQRPLRILDVGCGVGGSSR